jgi:hypothetical protein
MKKSISILSILLLAAVFLTAGCAETPKKYSGFLKDYPSFTQGKEGVDMVFVKEGVDFAKYNRIMLEQVVFYFKEDAENKGIKPEEIAELAEAYQKAFVDTFHGSYPLTEKPGEDVLRVRIAVTDIEPSNPAVGSITTVVPVGLAVSLAKKGATGEYTGIGSATMEAEFLDSVSQERLGAAIDKAPGGKLDVGKLSPAKAAFKFWATRLKAFLDESRSAK